MEDEKNNEITKLTTNKLTINKKDENT